MSALSHFGASIQSTWSAMVTSAPPQTIARADARDRAREDERAPNGVNVPAMKMLIIA